MPAPKLFLTSNDIASVTGISIRKAQYMLNMFEVEGKVIRNGNKKMVDVRVFCKYLCDQDGADPKERKIDIQNFLRERKKEEAK